jgi:hypothetical protein
MNQKQLLIALRNWLKHNEHSHLYLAEKLGYRSTTVIYMWLKRESIPDWRCKDLEEIICKKEFRNDK